MAVRRAAVRPWLRLAVLAVPAIILALSAASVSGQTLNPPLAGTDLVITVNVLQNTPTRATPVAADLPIGSLNAGDLVFLIEVARDENRAVWYRVATGHGLVLGWIPRSVVQIISADDISRP